jgi:hypothetical protein
MIKYKYLCSYDKTLNQKENSEDARFYYDAARELLSALQDARNELCLKCRKYREEHNGACDNCRWRI